MRVPIVLLVAALAVAAGAPPTQAKQQPRAKGKHTLQKPRVERDCTPINGRYGYYGNPWCDTGSSRPPDLEFRENHRYQKRR
ncbi:MAG: hypothetical protein JSR99_06920 [Proteobacteria bacterium]|nr:hypothetical protein [Pseudomonadota bacterium]